VKLGNCRAVPLSLGPSTPGGLPAPFLNHTRLDSLRINVLSSIVQGTHRSAEDLKKSLSGRTRKWIGGGYSVCRIGVAFALTALVLLITWHSAAFEPPAIPLTVRVSPEYSDRRFPYITYHKVWQGTPAERDDVAIPAVAIVCGEKENSRILAEAGRMAFYLGLWCEDIGFGVKNVMEKGMPRLMIMDSDLQKTDVSNFIVAGTNNNLVSKYGIRFEGSSVISLQADSNRFLFAGGRTDQETMETLRYMADVRLNFKAGAYRTFFNFVRLRGYVAVKNWVAAMETIESPEGLSACGRNMALASPMMAKAPDAIRKHVKHRNHILYHLLPQAVEEKNSAKASQLWHEAMKTCYGCHQGVGGIPRLRKFIPLEDVHAKHQRLLERFKFINSCKTCHYNETHVKGYDE